MVRRRQSSGSRFLKLIILGVFAGAVFVLYDNFRQPDAPTVAVIPTSTARVTAPSQTGIEFPTPQPTFQAGLIKKAELIVPNSNIAAPIIDVYLDGESWDVSQLGDNVGHLQGTDWFSEDVGNVVLSGHVERRSGLPGIFYNLKDLQIGDPISVIYENEKRDYVVRETRLVEPTDLQPLYSTEDERITLITCDSYDLLADAYQKRVIVVATRVNS
jgi:LPXTG-site transpeptidase (sortase) family protein